MDLQDLLSLRWSSSAECGDAAGAAVRAASGATMIVANAGRGVGGRVSSLGVHRVSVYSLASGA